MPANVGRNLKIKSGGTVIAAVRNKSLSMAGEPIDITSDDDSGFRTLLAEAGQRSIDMSVEGVTKDSVLRIAMLSGSSLLLTDITVEWPNGDGLSGDFFLNSLEESGAYNDAVTFSGSLQSSGEYTFTPA